MVRLRILLSEKSLNAFGKKELTSFLEHSSNAHTHTHTQTRGRIPPLHVPSESDGTLQLQQKAMSKDLQRKIWYAQETHSQYDRIIRNLLDRKGSFHHTEQIKWSNQGTWPPPTFYSTESSTIIQ